MTSRIRVKVGTFEIEYEGTEDYLKAEFPGLLKAITALPGVTAAAAAAATESVAEGGVEQVGAGGQCVSYHRAETPGDHGSRPRHGGGTRPLSNGTQPFAKKQLKAELRSAQGFYKSSYGSNFDVALTRLVKGGKISHTGETTTRCRPPSRPLFRARVRGA